MYFKTLFLTLGFILTPSAFAAKPLLVLGPLVAKLHASTDTFPAGPGSELAGQCLICHSASMVLTQPALSEAMWVGVIEKMRTAYGAPIPEDQVKPLAAYLSRVNAEQQTR